MSVEGREFRWSLEIWGAHGCTRAPFSNQKRLIFWIEAPIVGSLIFEPSTDWSEGEHNWWRILEKARSPNPFWTHPRLSCSFPQRAMQAGARKVDTLHFHYIGLREKNYRKAENHEVFVHIVPFSCKDFLQRILEMLLPLARSSNSSAMQTGWWARRYGERPEVNFIRGMGTGTWGGYVKMGAFICRMTTSNQNRQWVKLVNPLKPKRDEIDLFEQSWSLSWLYQQRWISLENKRLFFLGKPYWFSPSAVNGNGFGKFCSFLSLEWTSYPPLIFFPRSPN